MRDILDALKDLALQADEKSHYYVHATCQRAIKEIERLREIEHSLKRLG
jgi:hypothetical protein